MNRFSVPAQTLLALIALLLLNSCSEEGAVAEGPVRLLDDSLFVESLEKNQLSLLRGKETQVNLTEWEKIHVGEDGFDYWSVNLPADFESSLAVRGNDSAPTILIDEKEIPYFANNSELKNNSQPCWTLSSPITIKTMTDIPTDRETVINLPIDFQVSELTFRFKMMILNEQITIFDKKKSVISKAVAKTSAWHGFDINSTLHSAGGLAELYVKFESKTKNRSAMLEYVQIGKSGKAILKTLRDNPPGNREIKLNYFSTNIPLRKHIQFIAKFTNLRTSEGSSSIIKASLQDSKHSSLVTMRSVNLLPGTRFTHRITLPGKPVLDFSFAKMHQIFNDQSGLIVEVVDVDNPGAVFVRHLKMKSKYPLNWYRFRFPLESFADKTIDLRFTVVIPNQGTRKNSNQSIILAEPIISSNRSLETIDKPNIILISLDTMRSDRRKVTGYKYDTSPTLDRIAREGIDFTNAYAQESWTIPSHASMLSGYHPLSFAHASTNAKNLIPLPQSMPLISTFAKAQGYRTAAFTGAGYVSSIWGFYKDFDVFGENHSPQVIYTEDGPRTVKHMEWDLAYDYIRENYQAGPFLLFLHSYSPHVTYSAYGYDAFFAEEELSTALPKDITPAELSKGRPTFTEDDISHINNVYDRGIRRTDDELLFLYQQLEKLDILDNTVLIITADHGELLGEHDLVGHHGRGWDECVRIPMIFRFPKMFTQGAVIENRVELLDIMPTLLKIMKAEVPKEMSGKNLLPTLKTGNSGEKQERFSLGGKFREERSYLLGYNEKYKLFLGNDKNFLFNLSVDKEELKPLPINTEVRKQLLDDLTKKTIYAFAQQIPGYKIWIADRNPDLRYSVETTSNYFRSGIQKRVKNMGDYKILYNTKDLSNIEGPALILLGQIPGDTIPLKLTSRNIKTNEINDVGNICFGFGHQPLSSPFENISVERKMDSPHWRNGVPKDLLEKFHVFIWNSSIEHQNAITGKSIDIDDKMEEQLRNLGYLN